MPRCHRSNIDNRVLVHHRRRPFILASTVANAAITIEMGDLTGLTLRRTFCSTPSTGPLSSAHTLRYRRWSISADLIWDARSWTLFIFFARTRSQSSSVHSHSPESLHSQVLHRHHASPSTRGSVPPTSSSSFRHPKIPSQKENKPWFVMYFAPPKTHPSRVTYSVDDPAHF